MTSKSVYIAHPYADQELGLAVQARIETLGIRVVNPFQREEQKTYSQVIQSKGEFTKEQCDEIVEMDLKKIRDTDGVVCLLTEKLSIGTSMETFYSSYILGHPTFSLYRLQQRHAKERGFGFVHPWIKSLTQVHLTVNALLTQLDKWQRDGTYKKAAIYEEWEIPIVETPAEISYKPRE